MYVRLLRRRTIGVREQRAAEDRPGLQRRRLMLQQREQACPPDVVPRMAARSRGAAAVEQLAAPAVEKGLSRCLGAEASSLDAVVVAHHGDVGNAFRAAPEIRPFPFPGLAARPD